MIINGQSIVYFSGTLMLFQKTNFQRPSSNISNIDNSTQKRIEPKKKKKYKLIKVQKIISITKVSQTDLRDQLKLFSFNRREALFKNDDISQIIDHYEYAMTKLRQQQNIKLRQIKKKFDQISFRMRDLQSISEDLFNTTKKYLAQPLFKETFLRYNEYRLKNCGEATIHLIEEAISSYLMQEVLSQRSEENNFSRFLTQQQ